ncbi:fimbria/pilus outer membrane usher protein [Halomonas binhaiensis]|uniref:Fimbrial biogenesis outer membrane usher protein n=1 Tax=Halomonas binhaiensis TaxID=2562282 RepID=A0A856QKA7_9GAMM|nr:fimbria/pilus outer membrane usher protein [Halomonas binhaiensis]QEM80329.2 fimbrial biogenesis outer membrane usher protein [Halomonas binhaiensis]
MPYSTAIGRPIGHGKLRLFPLALAVGLALATGAAWAAAPDDKGKGVVTFNSAFLRGLGQDIDISRYSQAGAIPSGSYDLNVQMNDDAYLQQKVRVEDTEEGEPRFCFSTGDVMRWGAKLDQLPDQAKVEQQLASDCIVAEELIPGASFHMDLASLSGTLSIPQAYAGRVKRGYVDPSEWSQGITAGLLGYHANVVHSDNDDTDSTDYNINLNAGFNLAGWRLRHNGNYSDSSLDDDGGHYNTLNTYAQKDVDRWQSQLTLGEYFTPGSDFDSIPFTGVQLSSDDSMLPESERGFAPVIRGTAQTNAKVTVRQSGNTIYETSVSPGVFIIDDLYATGYAGDLEVTVTEADGSEHSFTVPFASVVQMLRPGASRFNLAGGRYRDDNLEDDLWFTQASYRRGINNALTLYGGSILAEDYRSGLAGVAVGTSLGAVALDVTLSQAENLPDSQDDDSMSGSSYRLSYSKRLVATGTNFALAAYRYSTEDFLSFADYARLREGDMDSSSLRERNRFQLNISQPLGRAGDLNVSGITRNYWDERSSTTTFQVGYNKSFRWGSLGLTASRDLQDDEARNTYMATASIPIGSGARRPTWTTSLTQDGEGSGLARTQLSGVAGENNQMGYGVYASYANDDDRQGLGGNLSYRTGMAQLGATYSQDGDYRQYSANASGTLVAHSGGLVFSPDRSETMALVVAEGASGASLNQGTGNRLDSDGEAIRAGLTPYRYNSVGIDPKGLPTDVELNAAMQQVAPRRGAVVRLDFATTQGKPLLLRIQNGDVPFGAEVLDEEGKNVSLVGQGGMIFIRGEYPELKVVWGRGNANSCYLIYSVPKDDRNMPYPQVEAQCLPVSA